MRTIKTVHEKASILYSVSIHKFRLDMAYSLRKMRKILQSSYSYFKKKGSSLSNQNKNELSETLKQLNDSLQEKNREAAFPLAQKLEAFSKQHIKKTPFEYILELVLALCFALVIAVIVRVMWFELYEIPTGSMRPTFMEQDHLTVSKTQFGINIPLETAHFMFNPDLVQRTGVCILSSDNLPLEDNDSTYFGIFPYKKRYIKRCMGKPEDTLYFYGGKLYGVDQNEKEIRELIQNTHLDKLEYVPFLSFEGHAKATSRYEIVFSQMNIPLGKLKWLPLQGQFQGEIYNGKEWIKDDPFAAIEPHDTIKTYSDIWGMGNFAMTRLLTESQVKNFYPIKENELEKGTLYLELRHHANMTFPKPEIYSKGSISTVLLTPEKSLIPLQKEHLDALMDNMYTARFVVKKGEAHAYSLRKSYQRLVSLPNVPDGTYEFYYGKAYSVGFGGIVSLLPKDHPLYSRDPAYIQKLYNLGIAFDTSFAPEGETQLHNPNRYAYFREGDLYLLGAPILKKEDPTLQAFVKKELDKEKQSNKSAPYLAFKDTLPPLKDGKMNVSFLKQFGFKIPAKNYLVLGDNHAMSADSRVFGFVPEDNLQGVPEWIIWPPGDRLGRPNQPPYPTFVLPRLIIWAIAALIAACWFFWHERKLRKPIEIK